jgi:hypothetical protein
VLHGTINSPALLAGATKAEAAAMIRAMKKRTRAMFTVIEDVMQQLTFYFSTVLR